MPSPEKIESILHGCQRGHYKSQKALYDLYSPRFYALCLRYTGDESMAQDALMMGFMKVFDHLDDFRREGKLESWMHTIFVREALHAVQECGYDPDRLCVSDEVVLNAAAVEPHDRQFSQREALDAAMRLLTPRQRMLFNLIAVEGYSLDEAAQMSSTTLSTVKNHYYQALDTLRRELSRLGIHCS